MALIQICKYLVIKNIQGKTSVKSSFYGILTHLVPIEATVRHKTLVYKIATFQNIKNILIPMSKLSYTITFCANIL